MGGFGEPKQASSRQGENKHSIPALWHSVVRSVKNSPVHVISCLRFGRPKIAQPGVVLYPVLIAFRRGVGIPELSKQIVEVRTEALPCQTLHVLEQHSPWVEFAHGSQHFREEVPTSPSARWFPPRLNGWHGAPPESRSTDPVAQLIILTSVSSTVAFPSGASSPAFARRVRQA